MKKYVFGSIIVLMLLTAGIFLYLKNKHAPNADDIASSYGTSLGSSSSTNSLNSPGIGASSTTRVPFNIEKIKSISEMYGEGNYEVATSDYYDISFMEPDLFFSITLYKTPIGWSRKLAEEKLIEILGLPKEEICKLNIFIGAQDSLDPNGPYGYGLSFCPGSVVLPELDPNAH